MPWNKSESQWSSKWEKKGTKMRKEKEEKKMWNECFHRGNEKREREEGELKMFTEQLPWRCLKNGKKDAILRKKKVNKMPPKNRSRRKKNGRNRFVRFYKTTVCLPCVRAFSTTTKTQKKKKKQNKNLSFTQCYASS